MAGFDPVTPFIGVIENLINGPYHTFVIPEDCGYSGRDVTGLLHDEGIKTWFHVNSGGYIEFNTRKADAPRAQSILSANKIQTASPEPKGGKQEAKGKSKEPYQPGEGWSLW